MRDGTIYFMRDGKDGPIKIGFTRHTPEKRIQQLQPGNPRVIQLMPLRLKGVRHLEAALHHAFGGIRLEGEWFHPARELVALAEGWGTVEVLTAMDLAAFIPPGFEPNPDFAISSLRLIELEGDVRPAFHGQRESYSLNEQ